jgi:succinate dehydrogenase/fumarate reductase cytochrome b subunit
MAEEFGEPPSHGNRMIATTFNITAETRSFDASVEYIRSTVHSLGGYVENSSVRGRSLNHFDDSARWAHFTVRIPARNIHQFVAVVSENYNVINLSESADDITESYFDSASRLAALENHERLLHSLLERDGDLNHIMQVYNEIANVRWQIESINSSLQRMEGSVNFSTVHIGLHEVMEYRTVDPMPLSFGERVSQAWSSGWERFTRDVQMRTVNTIRNFPNLLMDFFGLLFWVAVFLIVRRIIRKRKGRNKGEATFDWMKMPRSVKPAEKSPDDSDKE